MARLAPQRSNRPVRRIIEKRIATGTLKASDYEQTLRNLQRGAWSMAMYHLAALPMTKPSVPLILKWLKLQPLKAKNKIRC